MKLQLLVLKLLILSQMDKTLTLNPVKTYKYNKCKDAFYLKSIRHKDCESKIWQ